MGAVSLIKESSGLMLPVHLLEEASSAETRDQESMCKRPWKTVPRGLSLCQSLLHHPGLNLCTWTMCGDPNLGHYFSSVPLGRRGIHARRQFRRARAEAQGHPGEARKMGYFWSCSIS